MTPLKILMLVDKTIPDSSATSTICFNFANQLKTIGHFVEIACLNTNDTEKTFNYKGYKIAKFEPDSLTLLLTKHKTTNFSLLPFFVRLKYNISYLYRKRFGILTNDLLRNCNYKYVKKYIKQNLTKKYDLIISFSEPFGLHVLAAKLKKMGLTKKWFPILTDAFEYNFRESLYELKKRKVYAKKTFKTADKIFMVDGVIDESLKNNYNPSYHSKVVNIHQGMLVDRTDNLNIENSEICLLYAGLFYKKIREPKEMLMVLSKLPNNFRLKMFSKNCQDQIDQTIPFFTNCKVEQNGLLSHEDCVQAIKKSNILVNLSNVSTNQIPSKILEYIGFGKPIINFYYSDDDIGFSILKKYPFVFNFNLTSYTEQDISKLIEFCLKNKNEQLTYDVATENLKEFRIENICETILNSY